MNKSLWLLLTPGAVVIVGCSQPPTREAPGGVPTLLEETVLSAQGPVNVIDGDTLVLADERIRLHGVDAPEASQECRLDGSFWPCGLEATEALRKRIGGGSVECAEKDRDRYGRSVAVCYANEEDMNAWMVAEGWALAYRQYSEDYVAEESQAQEEGKGIWGSEFVEPWDWRQGERLP